MLTGTLLPPWLVLPLAGVMMLFIAAHIGATAERTEPRSRKRIRVANGWVMLLTLPLLAAGFGVVPQTNARLFAIVWLTALGLLLISILLALVDFTNTLRIARAARERLGVKAAIEAAEEIRRRRAGSSAPEGARVSGESARGSDAAGE